jgi:hypothetical protein
MRCQRTAPAVDVRISFKLEAEAMSLAEIDLLVSIWPDLLQAMQLEERAGQCEDNPDLE